MLARRRLETMRTSPLTVSFVLTPGYPPPNSNLGIQDQPRYVPNAKATCQQCTTGCSHEFPEDPGRCNQDVSCIPCSGLGLRQK